MRTKSSGKKQRKWTDQGALFALVIIVASVPVFFGAVQPWVRNAYAGVFLSLAGIRFYKDNNGIVRNLRSPETIGMGVFFTWTFFQMIPLPVALLTGISPFRAEGIRQASLALSLPVAWRPISYFYHQSVSVWLFSLALAAGFVLFARRLQDRSGLAVFLRILLVVGMAEACYGILQSLLPWIGPLGRESAYPGCATGTYVNRNHLAGLLEMVLPLSAGYLLFLCLVRRGYRSPGGALLRSGGDALGYAGFVGFAVALMAVALIFTRSRGGIFAAAAGLLTFIMLLMATHKRLPRAFYLMTGALATVVALYGAFLGLESVVQRFFRLEEGMTRLAYWQNALTMIAEHPAGIGMGNFEAVFPIYDDTTPAQMHLRHLHNDWLQMLVESGWPGFIGLLTGFVAFLTRLIFRIFRSRSTTDIFALYIGIGSVSGIAAMAVHSFFDFNLQIPANAIIFVLLLAIANMATKMAAMDNRQTAP